MIPDADPLQSESPEMQVENDLMCNLNTCGLQSGAVEHMALNEDYNPAQNQDIVGALPVRKRPDETTFAHISATRVER